MADKTEDAAVLIIGIDPLEAIPVIILAVKGRIFFVQMEKILKIILQILVERLLCQMPV